MLACVVVLSVWGFSGAAFPNLNHAISKFSDVAMKFIHVNKSVGDLGWFDNGPPFYDKEWRPISLPPTDMEMLFTKIWLFTRSNRGNPQFLDFNCDSIEKSTFNHRHPVIIIIHGFLDQLHADHIFLKLKNALLLEGNYNVIIFDWTKNNLPPYQQAVANTRVCGAQLAKLVNLMMDCTGLPAKDVHLIGHSLGSHIAGYAGKGMKEKPGRITALDPAGPDFGCDNNEVRLSYTDAEFVDAIHTNGGDCLMSGLGISDPVAHMDFYPNGGESQPGCDSVIEPMYAGFKAIFNGSSSMNFCAHMRPVHYFLESISSSCRFSSVLCDSYTSFKNGNCPPENTIVSPMGFHAKKIPNVPEKSKFFLYTNGGEPFCKQLV